MHIGTDAIRDLLIDHSLNGTPEPVFAYGKHVGERRVFNHGTMKWMVARADKKHEHGVDEFGRCMCPEAVEMRESRMRVRMTMVEVAAQFGISL